MQSYHRRPSLELEDPSNFLCHNSRTSNWNILYPGGSHVMNRVDPLGAWLFQKVLAGSQQVVRSVLQ